MTATTPARPGDLAIHPAERLTLRDSWKAPKLPSLTLSGLFVSLARQNLRTHLAELTTQWGDYSDTETALLVNRAAKYVAQGCSAAAAVEEAVCELNAGRL